LPVCNFGTGWSMAAESPGMAGKCFFYGPEAKAFGLAGFWRAEALPGADVMPELVNNFLFFRLHNRSIWGDKAMLIFLVFS
jgi:hypothetical protein